MTNRRDEVERIIRDVFADDSDHVVAMETVRQTNEELVAQLRRLVDEQEGGDAVVLVQRQLFNRVVGRLAETIGTRAALEAVSSIHEAEPVWGDAGTVGNLVAQLRTFAPETPIYGAFHADAGDGRKARVRGLTLSRERVDGRLIDTGNVLVPYSIVVWSAPDERPAPISKGVTVKAFQDRVAEAHHALFHDDPTDLSERRDRFYEEATETTQALGMTEADAHALVAYTFSRPVGEPEKEIGAAALTLTSLCVVGGWDMMACAEADLAKLQQPATIERIRAKRLTRHGRGPLPGLSHTAGEIE